MKKINMITVFLVVLALVFGLTGSSVMAQDEEIRIGIANFTLQAPYFVGMKESVEEEASTYDNIELFVSDANGEASKMLNDIQDMIVKDVEGVIISAGPLESLTPALNALEEANIPVVLVDRLLKGGEYTSWIGPDNYEIGVNNGEYIADRLNGEGNVVLIKGGPADNSIGLDRTNGALSVLDEYEDIEVVATGWAEWSTEKAVPVMEDILVANEDIDVVLAENDSMGLGALTAIENADREDEMFVVGVDGQKEAIEEIMEGTSYAATNVNNSELIGRKGFNRLMAILAGAEAPKETPVESPQITEENAEQYYNPDSIF